MTNLERVREEWRTQPTDLAGWAMRAMWMLNELGDLREAVRDLDEDTFSTNEDYVLGWQDAIHYAKRQLIEEKP